MQDKKDGTRNEGQGKNKAHKDTSSERGAQGKEEWTTNERPK